MQLLGVEPRYMGISPVAAIPKVLAQTGLTKDDVDVFEVRRCIKMSIASWLTFQTDKRSFRVTVRVLCRRVERSDGQSQPKVCRQ